MVGGLFAWPVFYSLLEAVQVIGDELKGLGDAFAAVAKKCEDKIMKASPPRALIESSAILTERVQ
jgi:hypothetical protein